MANIGYMQVVRHCNQYCRFCSNPETPYILDLETARRQIDDFAQRGYFGIILTGGEPSLSDHIPDIVAYAVERGLYPRMITNGQRLSRRSLAETYVAAGLRHYHISIHSCRPAIEDFLTGTENSHERAMQALTNLGELGATVNINTVINRYNCDHLDETVQFFTSKFPFLQHFVWNNLDPSMGRADTNRDTAPRLGDFEVALHRAMRLLTDQGKTFRVERVPLCYMAEFAHASTETRKIVKGEERMVHFLDEKGTVRQTDFVHLKAEVCQSCSLDKICGGLFDLGNHYDPAELAPVFLPAEPVIRRILEEPDITPGAPTELQAPAPLASQRLLLVLTHACNLRCRYCHEIKDERKMSQDIAARALRAYAATRPEAPLIKLFGGEPTLNPEVLAFVLREARALLPDVRFELTTNATLLSDELLDLVFQRADMELHCSLDGTPEHHNDNRRVHLPMAETVYATATRWAPRLAKAGAIVNVTIAPWTARGVKADVDHLVSLGFRRFNLLPAYYMAWSDEELASLRSSFEGLEQCVRQSWDGGDPLDLTNLDVRAMYTFFNDGLVVDVDGDVFQTNLFLWRPFDGLRAKLRRGHIAEDPETWRPHPPAHDVQRWVTETATPTTLGSTAAVDRELTRLCERLLSRRTRSKAAKRPVRQRGTLPLA
jgi:MoaA/NifB/PqqE/SkfB family radical SAM enzyme